MFSRALTSIASRVPSSIKYRLGWARGGYTRLLKLSEETAQVTTRRGYTFRWKIDQLTTQEHLRGVYESYMQDAFQYYVRSGMTVLDVGAHNGFHSLLLASMGAKVIAFEPDTRSRHSLESQTELNASLNITVLPYALSDTNGRGTMVSNGAMSHLSDDGVAVEKRTLDSLRLEPDVIKIDVEGHEPQVLLGAVETIRQSRPIILCDFNDHESDRELTVVAASLGYEVIADTVRCLVPMDQTWFRWIE